MSQLFSRRRVWWSFAGSVLLHGLLVTMAWRRERAPSARPPALIEVSLEAKVTPETGRTRAAIVGRHPSGPGRAAAGSNPHRRGSPEQARRFRDAQGRADGPGRLGTVARERAPAEPSSTTESAAPDVIAPVSPAEGLPVAVSGAERMVPDDPPQLSVAPPVDAERAFDALARAQLLALSKGNGGGLAGAGAGRGGVGVGLATELSGHRVEQSPVRDAPVIVEARPVECELPEALNLRTVVRVLVTRDGSPAVPRLLRSSGFERFDRCALRYVLAIRFAPGTNGRGEPLDVWMNVQVAPIAANQVGSAM